MTQWRWTRHLVAGLLLVVFLGGCASRGSPGAAEDADPDAVVAVVNGETVLMRQILIDERIFRLRVPDLTPEQQASVRRRSLDVWINILLRQQEAGRQGLRVEPEELERAVTSERGQFVNPQKFAEHLKKVGMSEAEWRERIRAGMLGRKLDDELSRDVRVSRVSEDEVRREYATNPRAYTRPDRAVVTLMSVKTKEVAEEALQRLAAGAYWSQVVTQYAAVPQQRESVGAALEVWRGSLPRPLDEAVFSAPAGKYLGPVEAGEHFHIFRVEIFHPGGLIPFDEARRVVENNLRVAKFRQARSELVSRLRREATIEIRMSFEPPPTPTPSPSPSPSPSR